MSPEPRRGELRFVLHAPGYAAGPYCRHHAVSRQTVDDPSGAECDHGGCRLSVPGPLLDPRSRLEILRVLSADHRSGGYQDR